MQNAWYNLSCIHGGKPQAVLPTVPVMKGREGIQERKRDTDLGPTASLLAAYLKAITSASLEPLCIMLAMQIRPLSS